MDGAEVQAGAASNKRSVGWRNDCFKAGPNVHDCCLGHIQAEQICQGRCDQLGNLGFNAELGPAQFHHHLDLRALCIFRSEQDGTRSAGAHRPEKLLRGGEVENCHAAKVPDPPSV